MRTFRNLFCAALFVGTGLMAASAGENIQAKAQNGASRREEQDLPLEWTDSTNVAWKVKIPGRGRSAPVVWGNSIFITTVVSEKTKALEGNPGDDVATVPTHEIRRWMVLCLDRTS